MLAWKYTYVKCVFNIKSVGDIYLRPTCLSQDPWPFLVTTWEQNTKKYWYTVYVFLQKHLIFQFQERAKISNFTLMQHVRFIGQLWAGIFHSQFIIEKWSEDSIFATSKIVGVRLLWLPRYMFEFKHVYCIILPSEACKVLAYLTNRAIRGSRIHIYMVENHALFHLR